MKALYIDPAHLVGIGVIAGRRKRTGDSLRSSSQDRGTEQNTMNDIQGVLGEYAVITLLEEIASVQHDFFNCSKPIKAADATWNGKRLDAKSLTLAPNHRFFILDKRAVEHPESKGVDGFIPVLLREDSSLAMVGTAIGIAAAKDWSERKLRADAPPARVLPVDEMMKRHFGISLDMAHEVFDDAPLDWSEMQKAAVTWGAELTAAEIEEKAIGATSIASGLEALGKWLTHKEEA
jgi:hypothetical protein